MKKSVFLLICIIASLNVYAQDIIPKVTETKLSPRFLKLIQTI